MPQVAVQPASQVTWQLDVCGPHSTLQPPAAQSTSQEELSSRQVEPQPPLEHNVVHVAPSPHVVLQDPVHELLHVAPVPHATVHPPMQSRSHVDPASHSTAQLPAAHSMAHSVPAGQTQDVPC